MLYAYGVVEADRAVPPLAGIDGAAVQILPCAGIGVAVSMLAVAGLKPTRERLEQHNAVNMSLVRGGGVVPFRFGNTFADEADLRRRLEPRAESLGQNLTELAGCVELTVRFRGRADSSLDAQNDMGARPGTKYLLRKRSRLRDEERLLTEGAELRAELGPAVRDFREQVRDGVLHLACLVRLEDVPALQALHKMSGPWPPSSFV